MAATARSNPLARRERRAKIAAVVLGAVFLLVVAIQVPKLMKHKGGGGSAAQTTASTTGTSTTATTPAASPAAGASLASTVEPAPIRRFTLFSAKDPFNAPAGATAAASGSSPAATSTTAKTPPTTPTAPNTQTLPGQILTFVPTSKPKPTGRKGVLLKLNGRRHGYVKGDLLPAAHPVFRVVGFTRHTATLRLLGGSFASGSSALKLRAGHRVVIENANSGTRYVLRFVRLALVSPAATTTPAK